MDLFRHRGKALAKLEAPLAARMRPRTLEEYVGQDHLMAPGRLLRRAIEADRLSSLIFYGPPGTGKTTLAEVIAQGTKAHFASINAVLAGVKDLRQEISAAQARRGELGQRTLLFVDEVHRFNKAQQDALLPWVEKGTLTLIGATTENPYFEVNKALLSRSRVFQLHPLEPRHLHAILDAALSDPERGFGLLDVVLDPGARAHLVEVANGDARSLLGALELAVETTVPDSSGTIVIDLDIASESIQQRAVLYDKEGDAHFDTISAFIKSLRGSDPDAALYWLAKMVYAGEDPRFILRRLLIFASEDVGLAAPQAAAIVQGLAASYDRVGMPEGRYHLAQATLYLATAPKSNSTMGFFDALAAVSKEGRGEVPPHLRDGSRDKEGLGHGQGYLYPHAYRDHWVAQQYLPDALQGRLFYTPSDQGYEASIGERVMRQRDAQLAGMMEQEDARPLPLPTQGPGDATLEAWITRTTGEAGQRLGEVRERVFEHARVERHHVVLDLRARTGLLMWEASRRATHGSVWARCDDQEEAQMLTARAAKLPELRRPVVMTCAPEELIATLGSKAPGMKFDRVLGLDALLGVEDLGGFFKSLAPHLAEHALMVLARSLPGHTQRLYLLSEAWGLDEALCERWRQAEEAIYTGGEIGLGLADQDALVSGLEQAGWQAHTEVMTHTGQRTILASQLDRWFSKALAGQRPSYADRLREMLRPEEVDRIEGAMRACLQGQVVSWGSATGLVWGQPPSPESLRDPSFLERLAYEVP